MEDLNIEGELTGDERVLAEAKRRWRQCVDWESVARQRGLEDAKFADADTDNKYQWPDNIRNGRENSQRPCLTINKTRQHNLHIINDAKQNTPAIKILPTGDDATYESAQIFEGIIRHIQYISNAPVIYDTATEFQVKSGIGYWRVVTDYAGDDSFDQEIFLRPINDPNNVYLDPDIQQKDGSDARFCFIYTDMPKDDFNAAYPEFKDGPLRAPFGDISTILDEYHVRIVEYFRLVTKKDRLISFMDPTTGQDVVEKLSELKKQRPDIFKWAVDNPESKMRNIVYDEVEWNLIIGDTVAKTTIFPGKYIPVVRVIGEETVIDGQMDRKGHTRALKDQQRMYNYGASASVEFIALQSKTPYIAPAQAIEGLETYWESANTDNHAVLPYNHIDDDGNPMPAPERQQVPTASPAFVQMMQDANAQMDMASGQYEATFGEKSNERSGVAISARQRQGETATYHFIDNLAIAIRFTGKILVNLIPLVYDTPRIIYILGEDMTGSPVNIDPKMQQIMAQKKNMLTGQVQHIFNPNVGKYDVVCDVSPGYSTKREEAFNALSQIIQQNPQSLMLLGDLWAENADFPTSDKIAERLRNMLPPEASGQGTPPAVQQLQQQMQQMQQINAKLLQTLAEERLKSKDYSAQKDIDVYKAQTDRMKANSDILSKHVLTPKDQAILQHELAVQEHRGNLDLVKAAMDTDLQQYAQPNNPIDQQ